MSTSNDRVLLLSIGTGNKSDRENTLFGPLLKSIRDGDFQRVILLPSRDTEPAANDLKDRCAEKIAVEIHSLPKVGQENDPDACFEHFNSVISLLIDGGVDRTFMVVDFTRGTKAMSAALVLAAARHEIPRLDTSPASATCAEW